MLVKGLDLDKCTMLNITFRDTGSIDVASSGPLVDADMLKINFFLSSLFYSVRGSDMMEWTCAKHGFMSALCILLAQQCYFSSCWIQFNH